jgi:hypothetical protein
MELSKIKATKGTIRIGLIVSLILFIAFYNIISQVFIFGYTTDVIFTAMFWTHLISDMATHTSTFYLSSQTAIEYEKENNIIYKNKLEAVEYNITKHLKEDFDDVLIEVNRERRRALWLTKINNEIIVLDKKASIEDIIAFRELDIVKARREHPYVSKKDHLVYLKSEEFIKENKDNLNVDNFEPYIKTQILNIFGDEKRKNDNVQSKWEYDVKKMLPKIILTISFTVFINTMFTQFDGFTWQTMLKIVTATTGLLINAYIGREHGKGAVNNVHIYNLSLVQNIIARYLNLKKIPVDQIKQEAVRK